MSEFGIRKTCIQIRILQLIVWPLTIYLTSLSLFPDPKKIINTAILLDYYEN
jgi:hypothetical protein